MTRDPFSAFMSDLVREYTQPKASNDRKWEFWTDGRRRSRTLCVRLWPDTADLTIAYRAVGTDGCMSELSSLSCDVEHLAKLVHALQRALAVAKSTGGAPAQITSHAEAVKQAAPFNDEISF